MSTRGSIHRAKATRAPPEMLERLKNWHVFSMSGSRQPTEDSPTNSEPESEATSPPDSEIPEPGKPSSDSPEPGKGAEPVPFLKASDETRKKLEGWLIFSPRGSRQSTSDTPQNLDSEQKPSPDSQPEPKS